MTILDSVILGIIEGLTEFLPISSTGHLIMTAKILGLESTSFLKSFEIFIQLGAILAVLLLYIKKINQNKNIIKNIFYAFVPTAVLGFILYEQIKNLLNKSIIIPISLIVGGLIIMFIENKIKNKTLDKTINKKESFIIGLIQTLSFIPGVSRSGAIIVGGLYRNISRKEIVEFSFLLALPTMLGATGLDLIKSDLNFTQNQILILATGFVTSFVVALIAVKTFIKFVSNHSFKVFAWYRIIAGISFLLILI